MGPFDRFNDRAKRVLALSQDEAIRFNHNYIGPEHLFLGLLREGEGAAARVLDSFHVQLSTLRKKVEEKVGRGNSTTSPREIILSPAVKKIIDDAIEASRSMGHSHVGTEHLLLGLAHQSEGIPAAILKDLAISLDQVRERVLQELGHPTASAPESGPGGARGDLFGRFSDRGKRVLALAQDEATRLKHNLHRHGAPAPRPAARGAVGRRLDPL